MSSYPPVTEFRTLYGPTTSWQLVPDDWDDPQLEALLNNLPLESEVTVHPPRSTIRVYRRRRMRRSEVAERLLQVAEELPNSSPVAHLFSTLRELGIYAEET